MARARGNQLPLIEDDRPGHQQLAWAKPLLRSLTGTRRPGSPDVGEREIDAWLDDEGVQALAVAQDRSRLPRQVIIAWWRKYLQGRKRSALTRIQALDVEEALASQLVARRSRRTRPWAEAEVSAKRACAQRAGAS